MIDQIIQIARSAGDIVMQYRKDGFSTQTKAHDQDFVTDADFAADKYIIGQLQSLFPNDTILTEESARKPKDLSGRVWMVDPIDGTRDFVEGGDGFSVMIGVSQNGVPSLGVVYAPAQGLVYSASSGTGAYMEENGVKKRIFVDPLDALALSVHVDRMYTKPRDLDRMVSSFPVARRVAVSSIGLKMGLIAQGKAHTSINTNYLCSLWDTCAPQVILEEAGGMITDFSGEPINYSSSNPLLSNSFVASNKALHSVAVQHIQEYINR